MKKLTFTLVLVMAIVLAKAQIHLTSSDMPQPGKANWVGNDTVTRHFNKGTPSSTAQSWDFTHLDSNYYKVAIYSPTAPYQAYGSSFPGSNIYTWGPSIFFTSFYGGAPVYANTWGYMYWQTDTAGFHIVGFRSYCGPSYGYMNVLEGPRELLMGTPATMGSQFPDSSGWRIEFNKVPYTIDHRDTVYKCFSTKTLTVDAFGTMKSPFENGTIQNVIRVHEHVIQVDSIMAIIDTVVYGYHVIDSIPYYQVHDTLNNYQFWAKGLHYPLAIVHCDSHDSILYTEYLKDTIPCYSITGNVFNNTKSEVVKAGTANLIIKDPWFHLYSWLETVPIDANGHFQFANVANIPGSNYLVQANPDTVKYPYLEPTYYGDSTSWYPAATLTVNQDTNITIKCQNDSLLAIQTGSGSMSGTVWQDTNGNISVARGVKVTIEQNPGGACRVQHTNNNGNYSFDNLPAVNYKIIVDIPGLFMDSTYWITVGTKTVDFTNLNFRYDTTKIYIYTSTGIVEHNVNSMYSVNIYPNPFTDIATVYISNPNGESRLATFTMYDVAGRVIREVNAENSEYLSISSEGLAKGMYIYEIKVNNEIINTGKVVVN